MRLFQKGWIYVYLVVVNDIFYLWLNVNVGAYVYPVVKTAGFIPLYSSSGLINIHQN